MPFKYSTHPIFLLPPFQIIGYFDFSRSIDVIMHLNICYICMHNNIYEP
jgi:hypothetical protein